MRNEINRFRGDTLTPEEITIVDKDSNEPLDISGATFLMTVDTLENPPDDSTKLFQIVGVPNVDQVNNKGKVDFTLDASAADNLGIKFYDVQMTQSGKPTTTTKDRFIFTQDITKD